MGGYRGYGSHSRISRNTFDQEVISVFEPMPSDQANNATNIVKQRLQSFQSAKRTPTPPPKSNIIEESESGESEDSSQPLLAIRSKVPTPKKAIYRVPASRFHAAEIAEIAPFLSASNIAALAQINRRWPIVNTTKAIETTKIIGIARVVGNEKIIDTTARQPEYQRPIRPSIEVLFRDSPQLKPIQTRLPAIRYEFTSTDWIIRALQNISPDFKSICPVSITMPVGCLDKLCALDQLCPAYNQLGINAGCRDQSCSFTHIKKSCNLEFQDARVCTHQTKGDNWHHVAKRVHQKQLEEKGKLDPKKLEELASRWALADLVDAHLAGTYGRFRGGLDLSA